MSEVTVKNDLQAALEIRAGEAWQVLYPDGQVNLEVESGSRVTLRLREAPEIAGRSVQTQTDVLCASCDFGAFGGQAKQWLEARAREIDEEAKRREELQTQMNREARQEANTTGLFDNCFYLLLFLHLPIIILVLLAVAPFDGDEFLTTFDRTCALFVCCYLGACVPVLASPSHWIVKAPGYERWWSGVAWLVGCLALLCVVWMSVSDIISGWWYTLLILWPCPCCVFVYRCYHRHNKSMSPGESARELDILESRDREALVYWQQKVRSRTIVFHGSVIAESGRPCVASWPGKYEGAWDALVRSSRERETSAAVVFLPEGTPSFGRHARIPASETR